jgi:GNAT superfamily N-acetyltransferase
MIQKHELECAPLKALIVIRRRVRLSKGYSVMYSYVRSRQLEGTYNDDPTIGCWPITAFRIDRGWGNPGEERWPYDGSAESWPPKEPAHIDQYAKENRIAFAYQRIRSVGECKEAIFERHCILISVDITKSWFNAINGEIPLPKTEDEIIAGHGFSIVGYDDHTKKFTFANSWGVGWGDRGYGYLPYEYFDLFLTEAWVDVRPKLFDIAPYTRSYRARGGIAMEWSLPSVLHDLIYGVEIRDSKLDERKAWGFALEYDSYLTVEELFVKPKYRGRGYSKRLISSFEQLSRDLSLPLRFWISHPDNNTKNMVALRHIASKYGYHLSHSGVRWADFKIQKTEASIQEKGRLNSVPVPNRVLRPSARHHPSDQLTHTTLHCPQTPSIYDFWGNLKCPD